MEADSLAPAARLRWRGRLWSAAVAVLLGLFVFDVLPHFRIETDLLALLPKGETDVAVDRALNRFSDQLGRNAVHLIGAPDFARAKQAAEKFASTLRASPAFAKVELEVDPDLLAKIADSYAPYRGGLLSDRSRAWLEAGDEARLIEHAQQALYSPAAFMRRSGAASDPLDLFGDFLAQATPGGGNLSLRDSMLTATSEHPGMHYVLVRSVLAGDAFATAEDQLASPALAAARAAAAAAGASVAGASLVEHAIAASSLAQREIDWFGGIQLAGLVLVLWWVFRSPRVLVLCAATLGVGVVAALAGAHYVFAKVQVLALVFCSNLAGVAIDYSIYFCADQFRAPGAWRPADAARHIGPAIAMSCAAAVLSYALLAVPPFPGLRQGALFCCVGLAAAYACVAAWFPRWVRPAPAAAAQRIAGAFTRFAALRERLVQKRPRTLVWLMLLFIAGGLAQLRFLDDVRSLQPATPLLNAEEGKVRDLIGRLPDSRFFLVRGADAEQVLETEEQLRARLDPLVARKAAQSYTAISQALPSAARQADNRRLLAARVFDDDGLLPRFMRQLGFDASAIAARQRAFAETRTLSLKTWLATPAAEPYRHLWLDGIGGNGGAGGGDASIITLDEISDVAAMRAAAEGIPGARLIDRIAEVSGLLQRYRERTLVVVALAAVASAALLALGYGLKRGAQLMSMPVAACLATLALFGWFGTGVSFFHVIALHLVMGLAMEYAILLRIDELQSPAVLLSASLAALLALLAFGLLSFSATPFIHALGATVAVGVIFGFAFTFLAGTLRKL